MKKDVRHIIYLSSLGNEVCARRDDGTLLITLNAHKIVEDREEFKLILKQILTDFE